MPVGRSEGHENRNLCNRVPCGCSFGARCPRRQLRGYCLFIIHGKCRVELRFSLAWGRRERCTSTLCSHGSRLRGGDLVREQLRSFGGWFERSHRTRLGNEPQRGRSKRARILPRVWRPELLCYGLDLHHPLGVMCCSRFELPGLGRSVNGSGQQWALRSPQHEHLSARPISISGVRLSSRCRPAKSSRLASPSARRRCSGARGGRPAQRSR